ncbi:hypothetical protein MKZ23_12080 [Paenibacillus sp. FSL R5-0876]
MFQGIDGHEVRSAGTEDHPELKFLKGIWVGWM